MLSRTASAFFAKFCHFARLAMRAQDDVSPNDQDKRAGHMLVISERDPPGRE
jgi:hypothetical protein